MKMIKKGVLSSKWPLVCLVLLAAVLCPQNESHAIEMFEGVWQALDVDVEELQGAVLGGGVLYSPSRYEGVDDSIWAVPLIVGKYKRFYSDGNSLGYLLTENNKLNFSLIGAPRFGGYSSGDSDALAGMEDRDWSIDGGLRMTWNAELFLLNVTAVTDLLGTHDGQEVKAVFSKEFLKGGFTPRVGAKWFSSQMTDYYYGVEAPEATASRTAYEGDETFNYIAGFSAAYPLGDEWVVIGDFEYEALGSEVQDSPIVDTDDDYTAVVGLAYRF